MRLAITGPDGWVPVNPAPLDPVLLFALGISVITGVLLRDGPRMDGVAAEPIEVLARSDPQVARNRGLGNGWGAEECWCRAGAASVVLVSAAAMLGQELAQFGAPELGFDTAGRIWSRSVRDFRGTSMSTSYHSSANSRPICAPSRRA